MPKKLEMALTREANKHGLKGKRKAAYIYGTLAKIERTKGRKRKTKSGTHRKTR